MRSNHRAESDRDGIPGTQTGPSAGLRCARVLIHLFSHFLIPILTLFLAGVSDKLGWAPQIGETLMVLAFMGIGVVLGSFALARFLRSTRGKPGARKKAVAEFLGVPDEREPEQSRRLWQWQCLLYVLLVPGAYFLMIFPVVAFASMASLGVGRILIARRRRDLGGSPDRVGIVPLVTYIGFLLITFGSLVRSIVV